MRLQTRYYDVKRTYIHQVVLDPALFQRNSLTGDVSVHLAQHFGDRLYRTCIPRNVRVAEAPSFGLPVIAYDNQSKGAIAYLALADEILCRNDEIVSQPLATAS